MEYGGITALSGSKSHQRRPETTRASFWTLQNSSGETCVVIIANLKDCLLGVLKDGQKGSTVACTWKLQATACYSCAKQFNCRTKSFQNLRSKTMADYGSTGIASQNYLKPRNRRNHMAIHGTWWHIDGTVSASDLGLGQFQASGKAAALRLACVRPMVRWWDEKHASVFQVSVSPGFHTNILWRCQDRWRSSTVNICKSMESELVSLCFITINKGHLQEPPQSQTGNCWNSMECTESSRCRAMAQLSELSSSWHQNSYMAFGCLWYGGARKRCCFFLQSRKFVGRCRKYVQTWTKSCGSQDSTGSFSKHHFN